MRFFVFVDTPYYPYVDDVIEADCLADAERRVADQLHPGDDTVVYLTPESAVTQVGPALGPKPEPKGLLKLVQEQNRYHQWIMDAKYLSGGFSVVVEPGSIEPE